MNDGSADLADAEKVAARAVRAGGDYLREAFRDESIAAEYGTDDVKSAADRAAEERVCAVLRDAYPGHAIHGEESGRNGDSRHEWVVDPLDGTNNFAAGLPSFATAVCLRCDGTPQVAAIYEPLPDALYLARRGEGATLDGAPLAAESDLSLSQATVSFVIGLPALRDDAARARADHVESALDARCKRILDTWSPCVDWGVLASGGIEGLVAFEPDVYEQYAGELLAAEAGIERRIFELGDGAVSEVDVEGSASGDHVSGVGRLYVAATDRERCDDLVSVTLDALDAEV